MSEIFGVGAVAIDSVTNETVDNNWVEIQGIKASLGIAVSELGDRVDSLESAVTLISDNVGVIQQQTSDIDLETPLLVIEQKLDSVDNRLSNSIGNMATDISLTGNRVESLESWTRDSRWVTIQTAANSVPGMGKRISSLESGVNTAINERGSIRNSIMGIAARVGSLETSIAGLEVGGDEPVVTIQPYDDSDIKSDISELENEISIVSGDISELESLYTVLDGQIDSIKDDIADISLIMSSVSGSVAANYGKITLHGSSLQGHESRISSLEGDAGKIPERTGLKELSVELSSGGNTLQEATGAGSTPVKFTMNYDGANFTFLGNWNNDRGSKGSGIFTADDGAGDIRVYLVRKSGAGLSLSKIYPFEGDLGDLDPEQVQVVKVFFRAILENNTKMDSEQVIDIGISACTKNTSWSVRTWRGLTQAFSSDIERYVAVGKNYAAILPELCGIDYTNKDVGAIGGLDTGGKDILDKYSVVPEDPDEPDYVEWEVPLSVYNSLGKFVETVKYRGRYLDGIYWVHPPFTDVVSNTMIVPNGGVIESDGRYTMPEANRKFYHKFLRYQLPAILRRIKEGYGMSWTELLRGPNYIVTSSKYGGISRTIGPSGARVIPILISNEPRAKGISKDKDDTGILARTISYSLHMGTGLIGEAIVIEIPKANIEYTATREDDLDGLREAAATSKFLDRTLCHEMVHAMMFSNIPWLGEATGVSVLEKDFGLKALDSISFTEGIAELICGADDTRLNNIAAVVDKNFSQYAYGVCYSLDQYLRQKLTGTGKVFQYSAGYCALRYFLKQCVAHKKGGS